MATADVETGSRTGETERSAGTWSDWGAHVAGCNTPGFTKDQLRIDPAWRTSDVIALARAVWGSPPVFVEFQHQQRPPKPEIAPTLADALQDAGCESATLLDWLRNGYTHMPNIAEFRWLAYWDREEELACWEWNRQQYLAMHDMVIEPELARLRRQIAERVAIGARRGIAGLEKRIALLEQPGFVQACVHDLQGTPPPGHIWIRLPYSRGGYSRGRREKTSRPLTFAELEQLVENMKETARDESLVD